MDNYAYHPDDNGKPFAITRYPSVTRQNNDYLVEVNSRSKFFKNSKFYKILTAVLIVLVVLLLIAVIVLAVLYSIKYYQSRLCTSEECLRSAAYLHMSIDFSTDPCDNFYQFACGRWSKEHPNHGWFPSFSSFSLITEHVLIGIENFLTADEQEDEPFSVQQARNLYKSCMDTESLENLGLSVIYKYLREAELPVVPSLFTKTDEEIADFKFDWLKSEALIKRIFAMDVLIGFFVQPNAFNRSENVMYMGVPVQPCPLPSPLKNTKHERADEIDYVELRKITNFNIIKYVLSTIVKNATSEEPNEDVLVQATEVLLNMTSHINELAANYSTSEVEDLSPRTLKEDEEKLNKILTDTISKDYPQIYQKYISYLFDGLNVTVDFENVVYYTADLEETYISKIVSYAMTTSDVYLELYMWWVTVFAMIINTSLDITDYIHRQTAPFFTGNLIIRSQSLDCSILVNSFMGMAVSYGLADKMFNNNTKPKVEQMLNDIKEAFVGHVNTLTWMDKETKLATYEKSKEMISFIGYPDWLFEKGALDVYYQGIVLQNDTFLDNMMSFVKTFTPSRLKEWNTVTERNWTAEPTDVNAYNSFPDNTINVPMAILAFPAYNLGLEVLNYGAIGSILGHELTHGFDNTGRKYDKLGNYIKWWSNRTIETFEEKTECFVKQYDNFTIEGVHNHVQGRNTLGENIADNGGLNHAHRAYHNYLKKHKFEPKLPGFENFTNDQLFFLAFGSLWCQTITPDDIENDIETDNHSPNQIRVIGTLQNSEDFARAYKCPKGSKMNPISDKCKVW